MLSKFVYSVKLGPGPTTILQSNLFWDRPIWMWPWSPLIWDHMVHWPKHIKVKQSFDNILRFVSKFLYRKAKINAPGNPPMRPFALQVSPAVTRRDTNWAMCQLQRNDSKSQWDKKTSLSTRKSGINQFSINMNFFYVLLMWVSPHGWFNVSSLFDNSAFWL